MAGTLETDLEVVSKSAGKSVDVRGSIRMIRQKRRQFKILED